MRNLRPALAIVAGFAAMMVLAGILDLAARHLLSSALATKVSDGTMPIAAFVGGYIAARLSPNRGMLKGALTFAPVLAAFLFGLLAYFYINRVPLALVVESMLEPSQMTLLVLVIAGMAAAIAGGAFGAYMARRVRGSR